jgi:fructose-1,6-bisphosphatase I
VTARHPRTLAEHLDGAAAAGTLAAELRAVLGAIADAGVRLAGEIARAAFTGVLGDTGEVNVHGDRVRRLDARANELLVTALRASGAVTVVASEELTTPLAWPATGRPGVAVCLDPLDGSLNTDVAGVLGTIFGIRPGPAPGDPAPAAAVLGPGTRQLAAGYLVYGPATVFAYTAGDGVHVFALDPADGRFRQTHARIMAPRRGPWYAANEGNAPRWGPASRALVDALRTPAVGGAPHSLRYCGALVADFHRILLEGGIYLYPADAGRPDGRIRLLYEAAPLALVAEAAGGGASTGRGRVLDVVATSPAQPTPLFIGSAEEVREAERRHRGDGPGREAPA